MNAVPSSNTSSESNEIPLAQSFNSLKLNENLLKNLTTLQYERMTPIQAISLPVMLDGQDVIAQAKTGSGKTAAFGLSLLNHLKLSFFAAQALVLCPTRELAEQVTVALRQLARLIPNVKIVNLSGGTPMKPQLDSLRHGAHIIVGTPGRVQKHLDKETLVLDKLQTLVLDEADRMLDMGFFDAMKQIIKVCPKQRQTLLFSATFPPEIQELSSQFMRNPQKIVVEETHNRNTIEQHFFEVSHSESKLSSLKILLMHYKPSSALIFCNTKEQTANVTSILKKEGYSAIALNGDMEQFDRTEAMIRFTNHSCSILVATDVAARGLDIKELPAVINFELAFDNDVHIHRIGRTGRAGNKGLALSLTTAADAQRIKAIESSQGKPIKWNTISSLRIQDTSISYPVMVTVCLSAGRKDKIRPGDILGALTKDAGLDASSIGKIDVTPIHSYVAIHREYVNKACQYFQNGTLKGRKVQARKL